MSGIDKPIVTAFTLENPEEKPLTYDEIVEIQKRDRQRQEQWLDWAHKIIEKLPLDLQIKSGSRRKRKKEAIEELQQYDKAGQPARQMSPEFQEFWLMRFNWLKEQAGHGRTEEAYEKLAKQYAEHYGLKKPNTTKRMGEIIGKIKKQFPKRRFPWLYSQDE